MKAIEFENEVTLVAQPIGLPHKRLDLVIDTFHSAIVDPLLPPGQNAALVTEESLGQLHHLADSRLGGEVAPLVEEGVHLSVRGLLPEQPKCFLEQIPREQGFVMLEGLIQARQFLLLDIVPAHQQQPADTLDGLVTFGTGHFLERETPVLQFRI